MENYQKLEKIGEGKCTRPLPLARCHESTADLYFLQERTVSFTRLEISSTRTESSH